MNSDPVRLGTDEEVKAAFIYHFVTFVQWPEVTPPAEAFTVAVLGDDAVSGFPT